MPGFVVSAVPQWEPVPLDYFKAHARVAHALEDGILAGFILSARQWCEEYTERAFATQTVVAAFDEFPAGSGALALPRSPAAAVASIQYRDAGGTLVTLNASNYVLDAYGVQACIRLAYGASWPATRAEANAVLVTYTAGWTLQKVPEPVRIAICLLASHLAENREGAAEIPGTILRMLDPYKLGFF